MTKRFLMILVMVTWCSVGNTEIINLKCGGYQGFGDLSTNSHQGAMGDLKIKIDTQKKTYDYWAASDGSWVRMIILDWQGTSIKAKDPKYDAVETFNFATFKSTLPSASGYIQYNCQKTSGEQDEKIEIASMIDKAKDTCKSLGFKEGTEKFSDCALKLYSQSVELAAKQNQQIVMQPQSSGSNVMTIYDPVRDSNALMDKGMKMITGRCTLGYNC